MENNVEYEVEHELHKLTLVKYMREWQKERDEYYKFLTDPNEFERLKYIYLNKGDPVEFSNQQVRKWWLRVQCYHYNNKISPDYDVFKKCLCEIDPMLKSYECYKHTIYFYERQWNKKINKLFNRESEESKIFHPCFMEDMKWLNISFDDFIRLFMFKE